MDYKELYQNSSGWNWKRDKYDPRNFKYEKIFGAGGGVTEFKSFGRVKALLESPLKEQQNLLYQMQLLGCVPLHITMKNQQNSYFNDKNVVKPSWTMPYALATFYPGAGTSINEILSIIRNLGQCQDKLFSQDEALDKGETWVHNKNLITEEMKQDAKNWKIGPQSYIENLTRAGIYNALMAETLLVGVILNHNWDNPVIYSPQAGDMNHVSFILEPLDAENAPILSAHLGREYTEADYGHWIILEGFRKDKLDLRVLHRSSYVGLAVSFRDIPDNIILELKRQNMRLIICEDHPIEAERKKVYSLDFSGRFHWLCNEETFQEYVSAEKDFSLVEKMPYEQFKTHAIGMPWNMFGMTLLQTIGFWFKNGKISF